MALRHAHLEEVAPGILQLSLMPGINSWIVRDDSGVTLIDAGLERTSGRILDALRHLDHAPADIARILLTHCHADHAGGVGPVLDAAGTPVPTGWPDGSWTRCPTRSSCPPPPRSRTPPP